MLRHKIKTIYQNFGAYNLMRYLFIDYILITIIKKDDIKNI